MKVFKQYPYIIWGKVNGFIEVTQRLFHKLDRPIYLYFIFNLRGTAIVCILYKCSFFNVFCILYYVCYYSIDQKNKDESSIGTVKVCVIDV